MDGGSRIGAARVELFIFVRIFQTICLVFVLAGCALTTRIEEPSIIAGTADGVSIRAGVWATPDALATPDVLAAKHCAKYNREAVLIGQQPLESGMMGTPRSYTYQFNCQ